MKNRIHIGVLMLCMVFATAFLVISLPAEAKGDKCGKNGCTRDNTPNGTVFCDVHAAEYAREQGYTPCAVSGCYGRPAKGHIYCSRHECQEKDCQSKKEADSSYCKNHQPKTSTSKSSGSKSSSSKSYSGTAKSKTYTYKSQTGTSQSGNSRSSSGKTIKKKYDAYDVYNYKNAQDFADDKYEEFYDYEDDYEDEDEAYDAAEDYWREHHGK